MSRPKAVRSNIELENLRNSVAEFYERGLDASDLNGFNNVVATLHVATLRRDRASISACDAQRVSAFASNW